MFDLAQKFGSPLYIFDSQKAKDRINAIKGRLPKNARLCYAIKANAFLVDSLKYEDLLFEVCSPGELSICEEKKLPPEKIVFSGVMKTQEDVSRAYKLNVNTITLESVTHCKYLVNAVGQEKEHAQDVIIRLTGNNQFGMLEKDVKKCIELLKPYKNIHIRGIHFFTGTQKKLKKIAEEISFIEDFCTKLQKETGITFKSIEYGPGLSYEYFSNQEQSDNFCELEEFSKLIANSNYDYVIELGRYIASPCGKYITKIMDIKGDEKSRYIIIDGGIKHINYYGQMMGMKTPKVQHIKSGLNAENSGEENTGTADYTIAGSLCTTADIVLRKLTLTSPRIGDLLVFSDIGAYSVTEGIYLFLSHPLPAVVMFDGKNYLTLRKPQETYIINS
ncbi:alanine racemase [uncultured Treponema sp.]|uniref:diaminopimelate decarboxylase family protein n=1 Tax=uncultured Treponema sp. TaxID=162155 RepID=UPI0015BCB49B|nr:alanine racemase [uncultured Treponema sp.]